jgi:hypothetical protein
VPIEDKIKKGLGMSSFFKRWSELKQSQTPASSVQPKPVVEIEINEVSIPPVEVKQASEKAKDELPIGPTLEDVVQLTKDSDYSQFVKTEVSDDVHHAAMKKLFSDPHYNVMDGLDIYIGDYSKEDPLPPGMLEKMVQSSMLGLFKKVEEVTDEVLQPVELEEPITKEEVLEKSQDSMELVQIDHTQEIKLIKGNTDDPNPGL